MSEVPLGAFLSGGVDSSSVVALMAGLLEGPVTTCSIGFEEEEFNELGYAKEIAERFSTSHHEHVVHADAVGVIEKLVRHYDEPFADSSAVPTYYVSKAARELVTVVLSGDGGDENFARYRRYYFDQRENLVRGLLPASVGRSIFGALASLYPKADWAPRIFRGKATFQNLARSPIEAYFRSVSAVQSEVKAQVLHEDLHRYLRDYDSLDVLRAYYDKADTMDSLSRIQYVDIKTYLADDILAKVDRASMANSLEVRAPLLDHKLMELAAMMPASIKLRGRNGSSISSRKRWKNACLNRSCIAARWALPYPLRAGFEPRSKAWRTTFSRAETVRRSLTRLPSGGCGTSIKAVCEIAPRSFGLY